MAKSLLPLCSIPKLATKDGYAGAVARLFLPFYQYGYWFVSGAQYTFPYSQIGQDTSMAVRGTDMVDTYQKAAEVCLRGQ